jgi:2,5-diamino-6-(ribosylamino)-4(3H)-pyrimidinone 5'-phosphate reductase
VLPKVIIHNAMSLDGRLTGFAPDLGLYYELAGSFAEDANLTGADTLLAAPADEADWEGPSSPTPGAPLLVVTDSRGRVREWGRLLATGLWRAGISLGSRSTPPEHLAYLQGEGIDSIVTGGERVDLGAALAVLAERYGVEVVRCDSGGALNGALLRQDLVDEISVLVCPCLAGGELAVSLFHEPDSGGATASIGLELTSVRDLRDGHVWVRYDIR